MDSFKSKYVAFTALLAITAGSLAKLAADGGVLQKIESEVTLAPQVLTFMMSGNASTLGAEYAQLKESPTDIESGIELLVTDFALSSDKAKALMPKVFAVAEWAVAGVTPVKELVAALES